MGGSQGEISKVDLTDGKRILRVLVQNFSDWSKKLEGVEIIVGFSTDNVFPNSSNTFSQTIWNERLEVVKTERFHELGVNRYNERFYGTEQEAHTAAIPIIGGGVSLDSAQVLLGIIQSTESVGICDCPV